MESKVLSSVGKAAGLAGIALGVFLLIFQGVLQKQFLNPAGLESAQAFAVILSLMILTFGIAGIGVIAWLISRTTGRKTPVSGPAMGILAGLIVLVLGAAVYVGVQAKPDPSQSSGVQAGPGGFAVGRDVQGSTINVGPASGGESGVQAKPDPLPSSRVEAGPGGLAVGRDVQGSTINVGPAPGGEKSK
jgi:hypothetical protein